MSKIKYELSGFISPLGKPFGFLMPIFKAEDNYWVQGITYGKIKQFFRIKQPLTEEFFTCDEMSFTNGDPAIYAFAFESSDIIWGNKKNVREELEKRVDELSNHPFIKAEVLKFIEKERAYLEAVEQATKTLRPLNLKIAEDWKARVTYKVLSETFVGREKELDRFVHFLESPKTSVLSVHTDGDGGIGKTQLLLQMQKICESRSVPYTKKLIDFYHTEARTKLGVTHLIVQYLGEDSFPRFGEKIREYDKEEDKEQTKALLQELEDIFLKEYSVVSKQNKKALVLFFDTYEVIQGNDFSKWLESEFFPNLNGNTRIVVSGRQILDIIPSEEMYLESFGVRDTIKFWKKCFNIESDTELEDRMGSYESIKKIHKLAKGRPIFLALFADWCQHDSNPLIPEKMLCKIEEKAQNKKNPGKARAQLFETVLIEQVLSLRTPEDKAVTYMAFAYRRMTPELFSFIASIPLKDSQDILLERLKPLSFIKYKEDQQTVLLHDEMRDLVVRHCWEKQDRERGKRKAIAKKLIAYYDKLLTSSNLPKMDEAVLSAERLYYELYADIDAGFDQFVSKFEESIREYRIQFCDLLVEEIIKPQFYEKLSSENQLEIIIRRIRWRNEQYLSLEALSFFQDTDVAPEKKSKVEQVKKLVKNFLQEVDATSQKCSDKTRKLFADLSHERGVANLWLNNLNEATQYFREAERIFRKLRYQYRLSRELNWFGYAHFRKGDLEEAEDILAKGIKEFLKLGRDYPEEPSIGIQNVYSNMNPALRLQGRFYEATNYGKIAASIADQRGDQRELARFLIALGETYELSNKTFEASLAYERADRILAFAPDPMLRARVLVGEALLSYRHSDYVYILEYYQRGKSREDVIQKYHEVYPSAREQLEQTKEKLESALDILTKNIRQPTRELADVYYYLAEYYTITNEWEKSVRFFKKSEELAKRLSSQYREVDAIVCQVVAYYYMEGGGDVYKNEVEAAIKRIKKSRPYSNLLGKLEIMRANFSYERYLKDGNEEDLRNAVERYVIACDHMYKYSRISRDRFYGTIRILVKRLSDLTRDQLPSPDFLESLRDIWNYDEHELKVCQKYSDKFDEIIDFTLKRLGSDHKDNALEAYAKGLEKKIQSGINDGKEALRFVPMYANMLLHLETDFGTTDDQAKAYHLLADTYAVNDNVFEVLQNNLIALEKIRETGNDLLKSKILIRLGTTSYRVGKYAKTIEHYRRADIKKNVRTFKEKNKEGVDQAISHFHEAKEILEKIWQHSEGKNERKQIASVQAHLHFRLAEHHVVTGKAFKEVADQFEQAIEKAEFGDDNWRRLDAIQSQIAYHYFSDPLEYEASDVEKLRNQFHYLNKKQYFPVLLARLEITDGNIAYDRIASDPADASVIEKAFDHYINATRYKAQYSDKHFYEAVGTLIDRIADLPQESAKILHQKVYPRLRKKIPTGLIAEDAYKLVEQFLYITGEIL